MKALCPKRLDWQEAHELCSCWGLPPFLSVCIKGNQKYFPSPLSGPEQKGDFSCKEAADNAPALTMAFVGDRVFL